MLKISLFESVQQSSIFMRQGIKILNRGSARIFAADSSHNALSVEICENLRLNSRHCGLCPGEMYMRIAILGSGAMGSLFGGYLSQHNDVWLIDVDQAKINAICAEGVTVREPDGDRVFHPNAVSNATDLGEMELVVVFVKAMQSREALGKNRHLIGEGTYLMSLQNGAGHEEILADFASRKRVIIGTTQHNSSLIVPGKVHHGGGGKTCIGLLEGDSMVLEPIARAFGRCDFDIAVSSDIRRQIWQKLFLNASASALTAILQVKLGYVGENADAWLLAKRLIQEAVTIANADNQDFDPDQVIADVKRVLVNARDACTSIYADIRDGVRTEVDTISGSVVRTAKRLGVPAPNHELVVEMIHALEGKSRN
jgi:2-dehydropantoate 2-reductase